MTPPAVSPGDSCQFFDARNLPEYLDAGVRVAAVGSALEDPAQLDLMGELLARTRAG